MLEGSASHYTRRIAATITLVCLTLAGLPAMAKRDVITLNEDGMARYIVELNDPALAEWNGSGFTAADGERLEAAPGSLTDPRSGKLAVRSQVAQRYYDHLDRRFEDFRYTASLRIGRDLRAIHRFRNVINGFSIDLTPEEAAEFGAMPAVRSIEVEPVSQLTTYRGPEWIGAGEIWNGLGGVPQSLGEGIVVGIIDSGVNPDHPSFADIGSDGYDHTNPRGQQYGLCPDNGKCNDKLIGIYEMISDGIDGTDTGGIDADGHGTHVASTAAGNFVAVNNDVTISGVAPHANLITYRVCDNGCPGGPIIAAMDQAVDDQVDVINYSIGSGSNDPWSNTIARAYLNVRAAGIFVATSAGNAGPGDFTMGSPADAPWIMSVANSLHDQVLLNRVIDLSRDDDTPLGPLFGLGLTDPSATFPIVHAADFGNALCGEGEAELQATCEGNTGATNPFEPGTFDGKIVVCDRGTYGRVEKGKNVFLAGAEGMILANTDQTGDDTRGDSHCLPASHIDTAQGNDLRDWLAEGGDHMGAIEGTTVWFKIDAQVDAIAQSSSRGPNLPPAQDVLKPNVMAPGTQIVAAGPFGDSMLTLSGTSMASPHVAGAAALLKAANPDWSVAMLMSAMELTANSTRAHNYDGNSVSPATVHEYGSGLPQLGQAALSGLYLDVTVQDFIDADPDAGGEPKSLNLVGLVDASCADSCSFERTVTDIAGGATWQATATGFPGDVPVTITPDQFTIADGGTQDITIEVEVLGSAGFGDWIYGEIVLTSNGLPDAILPVAVLATAGELPQQLLFNTTKDADWKRFSMSGLAELPDATFTPYGPTPVTVTEASLPQDPTPGLVYGLQTGTVRIFETVEEGAQLLYAATLPSSADDLDMFVGFDANGNGVPEASEERCSSTTPTDVERCIIRQPQAGTWWILVQNWQAGDNPPDDVMVHTAVVSDAPSAGMAVSGPGRTTLGETFDVRVSFQDMDGLAGDTYVGAVGVSSDRDLTNNVGITPILINRTGIAAGEPIPLPANGSRKFSLPSAGTHDKLYFDVPPGMRSMTIAAECTDAENGTSFEMDVLWQSFDDALTPANIPFTQGADGTALAEGVAGDCGSPAEFMLGNNDTIVPGRYFARIRNAQGSAAGFRVSVESAFRPGQKINPHHGLWDFTRNGQGAIAQGMEWQTGGSNNFILWYTYDEDGQPAWYIAINPSTNGNTWSADILRVTNDGMDQQSAVVGQVVVTFRNANSAILSYTLFGKSGSDLIVPNAPNSCPDVNGGPANYTGHWFRGISGLGGATMLVYEAGQAHVHYVFDDSGVPRWIIANLDSDSALDEVLTIIQVSGFCAVCDEGPVDFDEMGTFTRSFDGDGVGQWTLDYELLPPLSGSANRTDDIVKLSDPLVCP